jgi:hypothetical protein
MPQGESNRKEIFELEQEKGEDKATDETRMKHGNQSVFNPCSWLLFAWNIHFLIPSSSTSKVSSASGGMALPAPRLP